MTDFEQLLLAKGDADLICSFVIGYSEMLSDDFKDVFNSYIEEAEKRFTTNKDAALSCVKSINAQSSQYGKMAKPDIVNKQMSITDLLKYHEGDEHIKTRIYECMMRNGAYTVEDLLKEGRRSLLQMRQMGKNSMAVLEDCLGKIGYKLGDKCTKYPEMF